MSIATDLVALARATDTRLEIPGIARIFVPAPNPAPSRDAEFGAICLADGCCGFFYVWLGRTLERLHLHPGLNHYHGTPAIALAERYDGGDAVDRAIGLGAINAIYQHLLRRSDYQPDTTTNSVAQMAFAPGDQVGMVGFFPPLVQRLREQGVALTVIEKDETLLNRDDDVVVTLDTSRLRPCNKVLCTATTLLNNSLDEVLGHCNSGARIAVIGPTAGCFPDPLFLRGVDAVGGTTVRQPDLLLERMMAAGSWGDAVSKYTIPASEYPGSTKLIAALQKR